jgi:hypothetical protein
LREKKSEIGGSRGEIEAKTFEGEGVLRSKKHN